MRSLRSPRETFYRSHFHLSTRAALAGRREATLECGDNQRAAPLCHIPPKAPSHDNPLAAKILPIRFIHVKTIFDRAKGLLVLFSTSNIEHPTLNVQVKNRDRSARTDKLLDCPQLFLDGPGLLDHNIAGMLRRFLLDQQHVALLFRNRVV